MNLDPSMLTPFEGQKNGGEKKQRRGFQYYILSHDHMVVPVSVSDMGAYLESGGGKNRIVEQTRVSHILISTVFLGIDHGFFGDEPVLFETMIFLDAYPGQEQFCQRYTNWDTALSEHKRVAKKYLEEAGLL